MYENNQMKMTIQGLQKVMANKNSIQLVEVGVASRYRWDSAMHCIGVNNFNASISSVILLFFPWIRLTRYNKKFGGGVGEGG